MSSKTGPDGILLGSLDILTPLRSRHSEEPEEETEEELQDELDTNPSSVRLAAHVHSLRCGA